MLLALGVASLALVIALLATLRPAEKSPAVPLQHENTGASSTPIAIQQSPVITPPLIAPPPPKLRPKSPPAPLLQRGEKSAVPVAKSVQPPAKKIAPLPLPPRRERTRAPDELTKFDYPDPNLSPAQERELQRLLDGEQMPVDDAEIVAPARSAPPKSSPIPLDLIDDIEAFKQQIKREQGAKSHHE
jgi:general secretion pathway protein B